MREAAEALAGEEPDASLALSKVLDVAGIVAGVATDYPAESETFGSLYEFNNYLDRITLYLAPHADITFPLSDIRDDINESASTASELATSL